MLRRLHAFAGRHKWLMLAIMLLAALTIAILAALFMKQPAAAPETRTSSLPPANGQVKSSIAPLPVAPPAFDKQARSITDPTSPWVVANKQRPLSPVDFVPTVAAPAMRLRLSAGTPEMQVATQALPELERLAKDADAAGLPLMLASGYRSYATQVAVYANEVRNYGQTQADRQSARPGHSEHQTGLAIDLAPASGKCMIEECFGNLPEGQWLAAHAHEYGFIIRYAQGKEAITGYLYEPWHLRFVGVELAAEIQKGGSPTLEEFFGLPAAPTYL